MSNDFRDAKKSLLTALTCDYLTALVILAAAIRRKGSCIAVARLACLHSLAWPGEYCCQCYDMM